MRERSRLELIPFGTFLWGVVSIIGMFITEKRMYAISLFLATIAHINALFIVHHYLAKRKIEKRKKQ